MTEGDAPLRLVQLRDAAGVRRVARVLDRACLQLLDGEATTYALALEALARGITLADVVSARGGEEIIEYDVVAAEGRLLPPIDHPDPAHLLVSGTGLTHLGSADARNRMHATEAAARAGRAVVVAAASEPASETLTDSMKMFRAGLAGGRPSPGEIGVQPEWFFKGDGSCVVASEQPLVMPHFALDGGEEPEMAGLYVIAGDGTPWRLGFALTNEFSDHVLERQNYLLLAHSKLRCCALGPELRTGPLPKQVRGVSRVRRGNYIVWEQEFLTGEANMAHSLANLEHHHFKYDGFRRPGDVHVHCFGTATLSFSAGVRCETSDGFEIEADAFVLPLRNRLERAADAGCIGVRLL